MTYELQKLPFNFDALEPYMDKETVKIHYTKHHQGYVDKLNTAIIKYSELQTKSVNELLKNLDNIPEKIKQSIINNAGGVYNHNLFWNILKKDTKFSGKIKDAIIEKFTSFEQFKEQFKKSATVLFGSGWTWLALHNNKLKIVNTSNQNSIISNDMIPLIALDVWEHAYYLKYKNKRIEYIENFFSIINWEKVNELYIDAKQ